MSPCFFVVNSFSFRKRNLFILEGWYEARHEMCLAIRINNQHIMFSLCLLARFWHIKDQ